MLMCDFQALLSKTSPAMANHGFIPWDGLETPVTEIAAAGEKVFGVNQTVLMMMLEGSISFLGVPSAGTTPDGTLKLNIFDLHLHNVAEHDASVVHQDDYFEPLGQFDPALFQELVNRAC
jgi:hypothetical protein